MHTKVHIVKAMVFPVAYRCESWAIEKIECRRGDTVLDHTVILKWLIWEKEGVRCAGEKVVQVSETQVHPLSHSSMRDRGGNLFVQRKSIMNIHWKD